MTPNNQLSQAISDAYDETPYTSNAFAISAPGHLHAVAHLYGLNSPPPETARVLELGCAAGGNLLPFALANPQAQAIGIDLSPQQIAAGRAMVDRMGLTNLNLHAMSITEIDASFGHFDYIICHGVFSWVPPEVREAILRVCKENLAPQGIAYISYNTYPGWKASDVVRDALLLNSFSAGAPQEKLARAKEMLSFLEHGLWAGNAMKGALNHAAQQLARQTDSYLAHEYLEAVNSPCYFLEFVDAIRQSGLSYLTDAEPQTTFPSTFGENVAQHLATLSVQTTREMREQYLDFAVGRQFRKSLLVHPERACSALESPEATKFTDMHFAAKLQPQPGSKSRELSYKAAGGATITTESPALLAILETFRLAWPASVPYETIAEAVAKKIPEMSADDRSAALMNSLILLIGAGALLYRLTPITYSGTNAKPELIPGALALLAGIEEQTSHIGMHNLWHQAVNPGMDSLSRFITPRLDGSRSLQNLCSELRDALHAGRVEHPHGRPVKGVRNLEPVAQELLQGVLSSLKATGLLLC